MCARHHPSRDRRKLAADVHFRDRLEGLTHARLCAAPGLLETVQRRVGRLAGRRILARGLAEDRRRALDVENVVHDLKDRKSTRLNSSHGYISYAVFCLKKKTKYLYT